MSMANEVRYGNEGYKVVVVASVLIFMQFIMVFGRYLSRRLQKVLLEADDYVLLLATVRPSWKPVMTGHSFISWMSLYGASVALSKVAILLLYLRVFTTSTKKFVVATYVIGAVVVSIGIATVAGSILNCTPMARNWDNNIPGRCIDELKFARYTAIPNVFTGIAMLILPLPMVWRLNIEIQQKIALTATFLHGIMSVLSPYRGVKRLTQRPHSGFAASVARLAILSQPRMEKSSSAVAISWTIWTIVEPANYIIAACLPTLRPILVRLLPQSFFLLSAKRKSTSYSSLKISWPMGRAPPRIMMATAEIHGQSHLTGPWDASKSYAEDLEAGVEAKAPDKAVVDEMRRHHALA
ncbi:MAG: hypothetical protein LQ341_006387 [Variospora aurantia]|nr:MAG: hypothetical protein LQ341_006387 [Variospora aurantia]